MTNKLRSIYEMPLTAVFAIETTPLLAGSLNGEKKGYDTEENPFSHAGDDLNGEKDGYETEENPFSPVG